MEFQIIQPTTYIAEGVEGGDKMNSENIYTSETVVKTLSWPSSWVEIDVSAQDWI